MPPNRFESEVESFLEGSHGDRTHIKRADHHTVTPLCGTLLRGLQQGWFWSVMSLEEWAPAGAAGRLNPPGQTLYCVDAAVGFRECSRGVKTVE